MSVMVDNIDVTKCLLYKDGKCRSLTHLVQGEYINCNSMCDYGAYARKEQILRLQAENERLKEEIQRLKQPSMIIPKPKQLAVPIEEVEKYIKVLEEIRDMFPNQVAWCGQLTPFEEKIYKVISEVLNGN